MNYVKPNALGGGNPPPKGRMELKSIPKRRDNIQMPLILLLPLSLFAGFLEQGPIRGQAELEPASREKSTYVLQEFFIPVGDLNSFAPKMVQILQRHNVNTINISIRHAYPDPGTLLAWAREEVFAFVLYYKQGTSHADRHEVAMWTRELIDAAIAHRGAYYLPYQIWGTDQQFHKAYPRADEFFALKAKVDPTYKFRNKLWDAYYHPANLPASQTPSGDPAERLAKIPNYKRDEAQTYLTLPEWYLVYCAKA